MVLLLHPEFLRTSARQERRISLPCNRSNREKVLERCWMDFRDCDQHKRLLYSWLLFPINYLKMGKAGGEERREMKWDYKRDTLPIHLQETSETKGTQQQPHGERVSENRQLPLLFPLSPRIHRPVCFSKEIIKGMNLKKKSRYKGMTFLSPASIPFKGELFSCSPHLYR